MPAGEFKRDLDILTALTHKLRRPPIWQTRSILWPIRSSSSVLNDFGKVEDIVAGSATEKIWIRKIAHLNKLCA